jgi:deoxyribodipyrimidine photo-lyase
MNHNNINQSNPNNHTNHNNHNKLKESSAIKFSSDLFFYPNVEDILKNIKPDAYSKNRNHINGDNTQLSAFITHGVIRIADVIHHTKLDLQHKLTQQLAWRGFFQHTWDHLGDDIFRSLDKNKTGFDNIQMSRLWKQTMCEEVINANTGIPLIDETVKELYSTGYIHNHQRLWLMSYLLHWKKVKWDIAANWLYGYLLDGDLASNHLSTQWIGGSFSKKPYIFNATSASQFTPLKHHSFNTVLDISYEETLEQALSKEPLATGTIKYHLKNREKNKINSLNNKDNQDIQDIPELFKTPFHAVDTLNEQLNETLDKTLDKTLSNKNHYKLLTADEFIESMNQLNTSEIFYGIHPWNLHEKTLSEIANKQPIIAFLDATFHEKYPFSLKRWYFILQQMKRWTHEGTIIWIKNIEDWKKLKQLNMQTTLNNHYKNIKFLAPQQLIHQDDIDIYSWQQPHRPYPSFSQYYRQLCGKNCMKNHDFNHRK